MCRGGSGRDMQRQHSNCCTLDHLAYTFGAALLDLREGGGSDMGQGQ